MIAAIAHDFLLHTLMFMVAFVVEEYVLFDPVNVALLCAEGLVFEEEFVSHLVKEFLCWWEIIV